MMLQAALERALSRALSRALPLALPLALTACTASPPRVDPEALAAANAAPRGVLIAYERTLTRLHASATTTWHHGWLGNLLVNALEGRHQGLCYHWQREVFAGVSQPASAAGWQAMGIFANPDRHDEHHAVVIFDPSITPAASLLDGGGAPHALVLDPWLQGGPDIYPLRAWLNARPHRQGVWLQDISGEQHAWAMAALRARAAPPETSTLALPTP